jgi:hypothetical protein
MLMNLLPDVTSAPALVDDTVSSQPAHEVVPLKIAIVYDSVPAGRRAFSMVKRVTDQTGDSTQLVPAVWRFDLLDEPACRERATADAVAADLLILATEKPDALPSTVEKWVSDFLVRRHGTPATILAMWGVEDEWTSSLYERNQHGRMQPTNFSACSSVDAPRRAAIDASPFDAAVVAA